MQIYLNDDSTAFIRPYEERYFQPIQALNSEEGWMHLVKKSQNTKKAWGHSNIAFVVESKSGKLVGYIRGLTDTRVSLFICEILVDKSHRGLGIGKALLQHVHDLYPDTRIEMLATSISRSFYENLGYRAFYGYRKTYKE